MKKNILYYLCFLIIGGLAISSCTKDEDENPFAEITDVRGAVINVQNVKTGFYNLGDASGTISFDVSDFGEGVTSVTMSKSLNGGAAIEEMTITSFPTTVTFSLTEALVGTGVAFDDLEVGDNMLYTFSNVVTSSGTYPSGRTLEVPITCPAQLSGTFDAVTTATGSVFTGSGETYTGTVRMEDVGGGSFKVYSVEPTSGEELEDPSFGAYYVGWGTSDEGGLPNGGGAGDVQVQEICGKVSFTGASQWGEVYKFNSLSVNGADLTFSWENDYGESANVKLTRTDGTDWASNLSL